MEWFPVHIAPRSGTKTYTINEDSVLKSFHNRAEINVLYVEQTATR